MPTTSVTKTYLGYYKSPWNLTTTTSWNDCYNGNGLTVDVNFFVISGVNGITSCIHRGCLRFDTSKYPTCPVTALSLRTKRDSMTNDNAASLIITNGPWTYPVDKDDFQAMKLANTSYGSKLLSEMVYDTYFDVDIASAIPILDRTGYTFLGLRLDSDFAGVAPAGWNGVELTAVYLVMTFFYTLPDLYTMPATSIVTDGAVLNAEVTDMHDSSKLQSCEFQWGTVSGVYTHSVTATPSPILVPGTLLADLSGLLSPNTTYYYRIRAWDIAAGTYELDGAEMNFKTSSIKPPYVGNVNVDRLIFKNCSGEES